jgi:hypothetical protein
VANSYEHAVSLQVSFKICLVLCYFFIFKLLFIPYIFLSAAGFSVQLRDYQILKNGSAI